MSSYNRVIIPTAYNRKDLVDFYWWKSDDFIHSVWITLICLSPKQNNVIKSNIQMRTSYESVADLRRIKSKSDQVKIFHTSSFQFNIKIIFPLPVCLYTVPDFVRSWTSREPVDTERCLSEWYAQQRWITEYFLERDYFKDYLKAISPQKS